MRWPGALSAIVLLLGGAVAAHSGEGFVDGGTRESLGEAARNARSGLPKGDVRRALLDRLSASLGEGREIDELVAGLGERTRSAEVLLTGYYEPVLAARRTPSRRFRYPLYRLPADADRGRSRADIDAGALAGKSLELFWLDDPIESFFLHVQGSGRLDLGGGNTARVGYAGNNGRAYHSIGKELVARGAMTVREATAPAIKDWLRRHPQHRAAVLHTNPRYIFFREIDVPAHQGPNGGMGVPLVPFRSVAADPASTPLGSVGLLTAPMPDGRLLQRVVIAMDKGAAIRGAERLDLFVGAGDGAGELAGVLRAKARVVWIHPAPEAALR